MKLSTESNEFERAVALQAIITAILYVGDTISIEIHQTPIAPSIEDCAKRAEKIVASAEDIVGYVGP